MANSQRRWLPAALLLGSGVLGVFTAYGVNRGVAKYLALPDGAALTDLSGATEVGGPPPTGAQAQNTPGQPRPGQPGQPGQPDQGGQSGQPGQPGEPGQPQGPNPDQAAPEDGGQQPESNGAGSKDDFVEPIVKRNIFDSAATNQPVAAATDIGGGERRTDLKVTLLATVVAEPEEFSSALITEDKSGAQGYGIGDPLVGEATILRIEQKKVYIKRNDGAVEYIDMEGAKTGGDETPAAPATDDGGVASAGDNKFTIDKSVLDQALANPEALASQVRVMPHKGADGEVDGYRLSGIRHGSLMEKLGIKNGDIVHSVNGKDLSSTSAAMDAYQSLQNERSFSFDITRRNKNQTMDYEVK